MTRSLFDAAALAGGRTVRELDPGVRLVHHPRWIHPEEAGPLFDRLRAVSPWEARRLGGRPNGTLLPRLTAWYGTAAYRYSGIDNPPRPWTPDLEGLRARVSTETSAALGICWAANVALLNLYRGPADSVGWHRDNESDLGAALEDVVIVSVSLGVHRRFLLRTRDAARCVLEYQLGAGDLFIMGPGIQVGWEHSAPKDPGIDGERLSITFRHIVNG